MKKKIIKIIAVLLIIDCSVLVTVKAGWTDLAQRYNFHANDCTPGSNTLCFSTVPSPKFNRTNEVQGVRLTVVDGTGNRKSKSVDFISNGVILNGNTNLAATTLKIDNSGKSGVSVLGKYTRNEIFGSVGGSPSLSVDSIKEEVPTVYYLSTLPKVAVQNSNLKKYFRELYQNERGTFNQILSILDYFGQNNYEYGYIETENRHYLLVEPLLYLQYHTYGDRPAMFAGYGTATEVYKMLDLIGLKKQPEVFMSAMPKSIYVIDAERDGVNQTSTAGLHSIQGMNISDWRSYFLDVSYNGQPYGIASGHFWLNPSPCTGPCCDEPCEPDERSCVYSGITSSMKSNCSQSTTGTFADTEDWACILRQKYVEQNTYPGQFYQHDDKVEGNKYCQIACREEITHYYPSNDSMTVYAGHRFTIGNNIKIDYTNTSKEADTDNITVLSPIEIIAVKTCKTAIPNGVTAERIAQTLDDNTLLSYATINHAQFAIDYAAANIAVEKAWDLYQIEVTKKAAVDSTHTLESDNTYTHTCADTQNGSCKTPGTVSCSVSGKGQLNEDWGPHSCDASKTNAEICSGHYDNGARTCVVSRGEAGCVEYYQVPKPTADCTNFEHDGEEEYQIKIYKSSSYSYDGKYYDTPEDQKIDTYTWASCDDDNQGYHGAGHSLKPDIDDIYTEDENGVRTRTHQGTKSKYEDAVAYRDGLLQQLMDCNNYYSSYDEINPELTFTYFGTAENKYAGTYNLVASSKSKSISSVYNGDKRIERGSGNDDSTVYGNSAKIDKIVCKREEGVPSCTTIKIDYPTNTKAETSTKVVIDYSLDDNNGLYEYVNKFGVSKSRIDIAAAETEWAKDYKDIGYPNFPITFETITGSYDYTINIGDNKFGASQKFTVYDATLSENSVTTIENSYICTFNVKNCIMQYCPPEDKITGCPPSDPCCDVPSECCGKTCGLQVIYRPISLSNPFPYMDGKGRNPGANWSGEDVVKNYITNNRGVKEDAVYSLTPMYRFVLNSANMRAIRSYNNNHAADYNDFNLTCEDGKYCKSEFLKEFINEGKFQSATGSCLNATKETWESCRLVDQTENEEG